MATGFKEESQKAFDDFNTKARAPQRPVDERVAYGRKLQENLAGPNWSSQTPQVLPQETPKGLQYIRRDRKAETFIFGFGSQFPYSQYTQATTGGPVYGVSSNPNSFKPQYLVDPYCNGITITTVGANTASTNNIIYVRFFLNQGQTSLTPADMLIGLNSPLTLQYPVFCNIYGLCVHSKDVAFSSGDFDLVTSVLFT